MSIKSLCNAGIYLVPIPNIEGKPTKAPRANGWNKPRSETNRNGYTNKEADILNFNGNVGLYHGASNTLAFDIDDMEKTLSLFADIGIDIKDWLNDPGRFEIKSPKANRGKLVFKLPNGLSDIKLHQLPGIFELRCGNCQDVIIGNHPEGGEYKTFGDPEKIPLIPDVLLNMVTHWDDWKTIFGTATPIDYNRPLVEIDAKQAFLDAHTVIEILERNGYKRMGKRFIRPNSSTKIPGVVILEGKAFSHGSDALNDGHAHDAFECYRILECGGDFKKAIRWNPDIVKNNKEAFKNNVIDHPNRAAMLELGWEERLLLHVENFNKTHAVVMLGGKARIMRKTPKESDVIHGREGYEFLSPAEMSLIYKSTTIQAGMKKDKYGEEYPYYLNHFAAWFQHPSSEVYRSGVLFMPEGNAPDGYFNTWQGLAVTPKAGCDYPLIKAHIAGIICQHNQELIDYFYDWVAYGFQYPHKPVKSALVLRGEKGSGKSVMGHFLRKIWGVHSLYVSQSSQVTGNFNGHLADVCFLYADEAFFSGDKKHEQTLKALVTEDVFVVERKGLNAEQSRNCLKLFMTTNNEFAVPASADERRWGVYDVSDSMKGNSKYFDALSEELNNPNVMASFLCDMLNRDVSKWKASKIPDSNGLKDQRLHSLDSMGQWLVDCVTEGTFDGIEITGRVHTSVMCASYLKWCEKHKVSGYNIKSTTALGRYLHKFFAKNSYKEYLIDSQEAAISRVEEVEKIYLGE